MKAPAVKTKRHEPDARHAMSGPVSVEAARSWTPVARTSPLEDNRQWATAHPQLQTRVDSSPRLRGPGTLQAMVDTALRNRAVPVLQAQRQTRYVGSERLQLWEVEDEQGRSAREAALDAAGPLYVNYSRGGSLEQNQRVAAWSKPTVFKPDESEAVYTKVKTHDGLFAVDGSSLRERRKDRSGAWDVVEYGGDVESAYSDVWDLRAGSLDRGRALRHKEGDWKVDNPDNANTVEWGQKHGADVVAGFAGSIGDIVSVAATLRSWKSRKKGEKVGDLIDVAASAGSLTANVTKMVDSGAKLDPSTRGGLGGDVDVHSTVSDGPSRGGYETTESDLAGKATGNAADLLGLVQDAKDVFFKFKDLWKTWQQRDKASRGEKVQAGVAAGMSLLNLAKDLVSTVRNFLFTLENAWHGGLSTTVPALGAVISGLQLCVHAYDTWKAHVARKRMRAEKGAIKKKLEEDWNVEELDNKKIAVRKARYETRLGQLDESSPREAAEAARIRGWLTQIQEYQISKELQTVNRKRVDRQVINITSDFLKISGAITTATGFGATAGVGLKTAGSALPLVARAARGIQQYGRDQGWKHFNQSKTSEKKVEKREWLANSLYDGLIAIVDQYIAAGSQPTAATAQQLGVLRGRIQAAGLSYKAWIANVRSDPDAAHGMLMSSLAKRE